MMTDLLKSVLKAAKHEVKRRVLGDAPPPYVPAAPVVRPPPAPAPLLPGSRVGQVPAFADLVEMPSIESSPPLDRPDVNQSLLSEVQRTWRRDGVVVLKNFLPHSLIDAYIAVREKQTDLGGWECPVPYMHLKEIRDLALYKPLSDTLENLIGDKMGMHLNLTGWVSTERNWHQDDYLNPEFINSWYCAVWIALDDIHADSGPFQYVPGSHRWPLTRRHLVQAYMKPEDAAHIHWPKIAESFVNQAFDREIERSGSKVQQFLGKKGDVLIWHGRLAHRGSEPRNRNILRKSLIAHFSALSKRRDMPEVAYTEEGAPYFVLNGYPLDFSASTHLKQK